MAPTQPSAPAGPSADALWSTIDPDRPSGRTLMTLPAAGDETKASRGVIHVAAAPALATLGRGAPRLSLTLILTRPPTLDDEGLEPLVSGGVLALGLNIMPGQAELRRAADACQAKTAVPLFVREARWSLIDKASGEAFAEATVTGGGTAALSRAIGRDFALAALAALRGGSDRILVRCDVSYRATSATQTRTMNDGAAGGTLTTIRIQLGGVTRRLTLERSLGDVAADAIRTLPFDSLVRAVCPQPNGALTPVAEREAPTRAAPSKARPTAYGAIGETVAAMAAVLKTSTTSPIAAFALARSDLVVRPAEKGRRWQVDDLVLRPPTAVLQNLPLIDADTPLWPDRVDASRFWYPPEFALVTPEPSATAADSPYLFAFTVVGHDAQGRPGLEAALCFSLRMRMSGDTQKAWEGKGKPRSDPVPLGGLSIALSVPFRDEHGVSRAEAINATDLKLIGDGLVVRFALTDQWARLAYGALSVQAFQSSLAHLDIAHYFQAYMPVEPSKIPVLWGGKVAALDMAALRGPQIAAVALAHPQPVLSQATFVAHPAIVTTHPILMPPAVLIKPKTYGICTQGRSASVSVFFSCAQFGQFYIQRGDAAVGKPDIALGCQDAFALGQIKLALYQPLQIEIGIPDPGFSVYRSLQVPGRFLVLPKAYTVTRFEPTDARAYRPAIYLYSNVDANHPEKTTCILTATLRPAVTPGSLRALLDALRKTTHPNPILEWPTELEAQPDYTWAIPGGASQISVAAAKTPEGFQVSFSTGIEQTLLLRSMVETSGVTGGLAFRLSDGTSLQSTLVVDLGRVDGPWESGALAVAFGPDGAKLTNRVECSADVVEVFAYAAGARVAGAQIDQRIESQASLTVPVPEGTDEVAVHYSLAGGAASLEEIRTFIEDIYTNVVFVCAFDMAGEGLQKLTVEGRLAGVPSDASLDLTPATISGQMPFVLPLTAYLSQPTLQYRATATAANLTVRSGQWRDWRLDVRGNVVELYKDVTLET